MPPLDLDGIDLNPETIEQLDTAARKLKISRQALIKQFIRRGLNEQNLPQKQRRALGEWPTLFLRLGRRAISSRSGFRATVMASF